MRHSSSASEIDAGVSWAVAAERKPRRYHSFAFRDQNPHSLPRRGPSHQEIADRNDKQLTARLRRERGAISRHLISSQLTHKGSAKQNASRLTSAEKKMTARKEKKTTSRARQEKRAAFVAKTLLGRTKRVIITEWRRHYRFLGLHPEADATADACIRRYVAPKRRTEAPHLSPLSTPCHSGVFFLSMAGN